MKKIKAYAFRECSAKADKGVKEVFEDAIRAGQTAPTQQKKGGCLLL